MKFPEDFRVHDPGLPGYRSRLRDPFGIFVVPDKCDRLWCLATDGDGVPGLPRWEHVSVTVRNRRGLALRRCPTWEQLARVKALFWDDAEAVMQLHPPKSEHVNFHPFCLHLWRPVDAAIPLPPSVLVGPRGITRPV